MKEKKQFFIPKNYDKKFEWIPGISGWQHLAFVPIAAIDYLFIKYTGFSVSNKITVAAVLTGLPWVMMATHPVRENVPLYKHLLWRLKFVSRQRQYLYKKEGYVHVIPETEDSGKNREKEIGTSEKINPRLNSLKVNRKRTADHTG